MRSYSASVNPGGSRPIFASARRSTLARRYQLESWWRAMPYSHADAASSPPPRNARRSATADANVSAISSAATCASNVRRAKKATSEREWAL
jgi:hypothetical protein